MKIKTADLIGPALDWAVAQCEDKVHGYKHQLVDDCRDVIPYTPSTDWAIGGPLIERERLCVGCKHQQDPDYCPILDPNTLYWARTTSGGYLSYGPTHLIAAMRCLVASRLGDEVDVPDELI